MPIRDLREKYGKNKKGREAVNAAIRAEMVGGDDCLDAMQCLHKLARKLEQGNYPGLDDAQDACDAANDVREIMAAEIARRYGLKSKE